MDKASSPEVLNLARKAFKQKRFKKAIKYYEEYLQKDKMNAEICEELGISYFHINNIRKSQKFFEDAIKNSDARYKSHAYLAFIYGKSGKDKLSELEAAKAFEINPRSLEAIDSYVSLLVNKNHLDEAKELLIGTRLPLKEDWNTHYALLIIGAKNKNRKEVNKEFLSVINLHPPFFIYFFSLEIYFSLYIPILILIFLITTLPAVIFKIPLLLLPFFFFVCLTIITFFSDIIMHNKSSVSRRIFSILFNLLGIICLFFLVFRK